MFPGAGPASGPVVVPAAFPSAVPSGAPSAGPSAGRSAAPENDFSALVFPLLGEQSAGARRSRDADRARLDEQWRARGHAAGYTEGLRAAEQAVAERIHRLEVEHAHRLRVDGERAERMLAVLHTAARALDARTVPVLRDAEDTVLAAAFDLAEAIVGHALADEAAAARSALGRAVAAAGGGASASGELGSSGGLLAAPGALGAAHTVRLHPDDLAALDPAVTAATGVAFVADAHISRGDAVSEFPDGYLDARIGTALERAKAALGGAS
ncbi:flagellar assembly protein FliH [Cryobacterium sp. PAMC25264]|uniref:flagellar assembly protein FliH n=1 Tax=Cryobacterium sp. PAMC25264 TaxID=2861288 RepID=UPI001C62D107|nr:flagellar assembly protein FliH [Cryobacterium sp. PAMC25264]QYF74660.1 flagellar assembly protein FliH [Cryobacterium sp. PAMC25264]